MPSGAVYTTGWEKPMLRFRSLPCIEARKPTPTSSSLRLKPSETPTTMLARIARAVPAIGTLAASAADSCTWPFSTLKSTPVGRARLRVPFGPFTVTLSAATLNSTPFGREIGFLATRDMGAYSLGHQADDFAAHALGAGLAVGHQTLGSGDDGHAEAGQHLGQVVLAPVLTQAGTGHALEALDHRLALVVLQGDLESRLGALADHAEIADIAFVLQDLGNRQLHLRGRHGNLRLAAGERILDAHQHVADGISHAHCCLPFPGLWSTDIRKPPEGPAITSWPCAGRARRHAWWLRAACCGRGRTSDRRHAGDRSARSGCGCGSGSSRAAASA